MEMKTTGYFLDKAGTKIEIQLTDLEWHIVKHCICDIDAELDMAEERGEDLETFFKGLIKEALKKNIKIIEIN